MDHYALEAVFTSVVPLGLTSQGLRLDIEFSGSVTDGPLTGASVTGTDYLLIRGDGIAEINIRERIVLDDATTASVRVLGYVVPPVPLPGPDVLTDPEFVWPDLDLPLHGAAFFDTAPEHLAAALSTVYACTGQVNVGRGTIHVTARTLAPTPAEPTPAAGA